MTNDTELFHFGNFSFGCGKFVCIKVACTCMEWRAFYDDVVFHSMLVLIQRFEARNEKLREIVNDSVKVINHGCMDAGDRWLLASNLCLDGCEVNHVDEAALTMSMAR